MGKKIRLGRRVSPPYRCAWWPKGCRFTSTSWRKIKHHQKKCTFGDPRKLV